MATPAFAAPPDAPPDAPGAAAPSSDVIVTGTRQSGVKAVNSAAPIQVVGATALKQVGQPDLIQALAQNLPSFNAQSLGGDLANLTLAAALRGLSPNDTLVLVNGARRHATANLAVDGGGPYQGAATTDLSFIPVGAIDHIEVLQDGAAAQYGTDAIAGVVNIILKDADHGGTLSATGGQFYHGDGDSGAWSINKGFSLGDHGFLNLTAEERYHGFTQRGGPDYRYYTPNGALLPGLTPAVNETGIPAAPGAPDVNKIVADAEFNIYNLFYNAGYELGDGFQAYSFGSYGHRDASSYENYRPPSKVSSVYANDPSNAMFYPLPEGFDPKEALDENDFSVTGGVKGALVGWNVDLSTTYGQDQDSISTVDSANVQLYQALQPLSATLVRPQSTFYDGAFINSEWTGNLDVDRSFEIGLASPLNIAIGGEARQDSFTIDAGDAASTYGAGAQSFPGFESTDAGTHRRSNYAGYIDIAADPFTGLHLDLAGRYEYYTDFGSAPVAKLTARYDFNPAFAIRGTVSTGFRAPTLAEEYYSATNVSPSSAVVQLPANSAAAQSAGFSSLKPEKSTNYSIGFVAHPIERLQITVDAYEIDITNRIVGSGFLLGSVGTATVSQGVLNAIKAHGNTLEPGLSYTGISIFTNGANTRTRGVELTATYASDFGDIGHVDWTVGFNYNDNEITHLAPLPAVVTSVPYGQTAILSPTAISALTTATPREKAVLNGYYTHDKWSVNLRETVYGSTSEIVSTSGTGVGGYTEKVGVTGITDLDIGYKITDSLKLDVGAYNLFNTEPPTVPNIATTSGSGLRPEDGGNVYNAPIGFSPFGIDGGYYYGRVTYTF